jgi:N6-adenosine-specific RNA methylase IME4/ParB-like chromosome segregation protein Spo0J
MNEAHPLADLLPAMSELEYAELRESIRANGLRQPITLHPDGSILDGRHRAKACAELGIPVAAVPFEGEDSDCLAFVLDLNLKRRHLDESQRAMIAADLANLGEGRPGKTASIEAVSQARAAGLLNVSRTSTQRAVLVRDSAIPEISAAVRLGQMPVSVAARVAQLPAPRQQQIAADMHNGKSLLTTVLAATRTERVTAIELASNACALSALGRTFPVLYADPAWHFKAWSAGGQQKAAEMHYPTMTPAELAAMPVAEIAAANSVLFMWAVPALFPEALDVLKAWGFEYKTFAVWVKPRIACGHWLRGQHEPLIVATRGNMPPPPALHSSVFEGTTSGRHSEKPTTIRDWISEAYPDAAKIELFARTAPAPGWHVWGHEAVTSANADYQTPTCATPRVRPAAGCILPSGCTADREVFYFQK